MQKYSQFAKLLQSALTIKKSIKSIILDHTSDPSFIRQAYSLIIKAQKYWDKLEDIVNVLSEKVNFEFKNKYLLVILILELFNPHNKSKKIGGKISRVLKDNAVLIKQMILDHQIVFQPHLIKEFITLRITNLSEATSFLQSVSYNIDQHNPQLYNVPFGQYSDYLQKYPEFRSQKWYVIQSKASAMPAFLLFRGFASQKQQQYKFDVIDCCAAPGNKTLQLAEYMKQYNIEGKVFAFEKDPKRFLVLQKRIQFYGFDNIIPQCQDFFEVDEQNYKNVKYILLDPSCSGSGMLQSEFNKEHKAIDQLASMQLQLLQKCSYFRNCIRIIYSTCSIFEEENERVANYFLEGNSNWRSLKVFSEWKRRGINNGTNQNKKYVRFDRGQDNSDGFFIALFKRNKID